MNRNSPKIQRMTFVHGQTSLSDGSTSFGHHIRPTDRSNSAGFTQRTFILVSDSIAGNVRGSLETLGPRPSMSAFASYKGSQHLVREDMMLSRSGSQM